MEPNDSEIVIYKKCPSAFFGTNLLTQLHVLGVYKLIIGGFCTSGGVRATFLGLDAFEENGKMPTKLSFLDRAHVWIS
jgi:nicotinamidase-related amidase